MGDSQMTTKEQRNKKIKKSRKLKILPKINIFTVFIINYPIQS